jgi:hypothetical protein
MLAGFVAEIAKPHRLTPELFEHELVRPGQPVMIRGLVDDFAARQWEFPRIAQHLPKRPLHATGVSGGARATWTLTPEELVERIATDLPSSAGGAHADWLFDVHDELPELLRDLPPPDVCNGERQYRLFMGHETVTPGHYHSFQHALICLIHGKKQVFLYSPKDSRRLYPEPIATETRHYQSSQVDFAEPDLGKFPRVADARVLKATLGPGDALFVPIHWWHAVYGEGGVMSTSLFWNARLRDYRFPHPGLTAVAGVLRSHVERRIRKLGKVSPRSIPPP